MSAKPELESVVAPLPYHIAETPWRFKETTTPLRRPLFNTGDRLVFEYTSRDRYNVDLVVKAPNGADVLGAPIALTVAKNSDAQLYTATAYGRLMTFVVRGRKLYYTAIYESEPHRHPDEGGEGDPW